MAHEDRTEKPTPKRKKEARRKGQIPRSPDVSAWTIILAASVVIPDLFKAADRRLVGLIDQSSAAMVNPSPAAALSVMQRGLGDLVALVLPAAAVLAVVGVASNVAQTGLVLSGHGLAPKWEKLNPFKGLKHLLSVQSAWTLLKQLLKVAVLVVIAYSTVAGMERRLIGASTPAMAPVVSYTGGRLVALTREVAAAGLLLAVADYAWQRRRVNRSLRMTKQEVKDEHRQQEGDQAVRGAIRRRQYRMSRARMMAAVAGADVVVVNPTHYAVALRYDQMRGGAPVVVAKGAGNLALKIREEGCKHKVPVVEDPPLARAVYAACELDDAIPPELFLAVARLLAFVFTLSPVTRAAGLVHRRPTSALVA